MNFFTGVEEIPPSGFPTELQLYMKDMRTSKEAWTWHYNPIQALGSGDRFLLYYIDTVLLIDYRCICIQLIKLFKLLIMSVQHII